MAFPLGPRSERPVSWDFDPEKDVTNLAKHGISLARAAEMDFVSVEDDLRYPELRKRGYAILDGLPYCLAFVDRGGVRRAISLRRCRIKEFERYVA